MMMVSGYRTKTSHVASVIVPWSQGSLEASQCLISHLSWNVQYLCLRLQLFGFESVSWVSPSVSASVLGLNTLCTFLDFPAASSCRLLQ